MTAVVICVWAVSMVIVALLGCYQAGTNNESLADHFKRDSVIGSFIAAPLYLALLACAGALYAIYTAGEGTFLYVRTLRPARAAWFVISRPFTRAYELGARRRNPALPQARIR